MEHYEKGEVRVVETDFSQLGLEIDDNAVHMRVSGGSKIRNLMGFATKKFKEPEIKQMTWNGSGQAVAKAITCAEIMKRKLKDLHQINKVRYHRVEEFWEPKLEHLERLKVNRDIPAITILLSKQDLDTSMPGYQAPGSIEKFLNLNDSVKKSSRDKRKNSLPKRTPGNDSNSMSWIRDKKAKRKDPKSFGDKSSKNKSQKKHSKNNTEQNNMEEPIDSPKEEPMDS